MLDQLDQVPWSELSHAYGSAADVPGMLRRLASGSESDFEEAMYDYCSALLHQGDLYNATKATVPFLVELASQIDGHQRLQLLGALECIASSYREAIAFRDSNPDVAASTQTRWAESEPVYRAALEAVCEHAVSLSGHLLDEDPNVRAAAAFLLAQLESRDPDLVVVLLDAINQESDPRTRAAMRLAIAVLIGSHPNSTSQKGLVEQFNRLLDDGSAENPEASIAVEDQVAAVVGLLWLKQTGERSTSELLECVGQHLEQQRDLFENLIWRHSNQLDSLVAHLVENDRETSRQWLRCCLAHSSEDIRKSAVWSLGDYCKRYRSGVEEFRETIEDLVQDRTESIQWRLSTVATFGRFGRQILEACSKQREAKDAKEQLERLDANHALFEKSFRQSRPLLLGKVSSHVHTMLELKNAQHFEKKTSLRHAITCIGYLGTKAVAALDALASLDSHDDPWVTAEAIAARVRVSPEPKQVLPELLAQIKPSPPVLILIRCLREMGPAASDALPKLRELVNQPERFFQHDGILPAIEMDELFIEECQSAINAIAT